MNHAAGYFALGGSSTASLQGSAARVGATIVLAIAMNGSAATTAGVSPESHVLKDQPSSWTNSGQGLSTEAGRLIEDRASRAQTAAIAELRRLSGVTWEQFARLFQVSRRAAHFWASGKQMTAENEEHLQRIIATLRLADRGSATANRQALLNASPEGRIPLDSLVERDYDEAIRLLTGSGQSGKTPLSSRSSRVSADRLPPAPTVLLGASQESLGGGYGRARPVVRRKG